MERILDKWVKAGFHPVTGTDSLNQETERLEGIGEKYAQQLQEAGVYSLMDLWMSSTVVLSNKTGIDPDLILRWQKMADVARIDGVGPQYAELLVSAGVETVQKLASSEVADVQERIEKALKKHPTMVGSKPGEKTIEGWIMNALTIKLYNAPYTGQPPQDA